MNTIVSESVPPPAISVGPLGFFFHIITIYYSYLAIFLALSHCVYFADTSVQPNRLSVASATIALPATSNIEVITTTSSIDPGTESSTKVPHTSDALLLIYFKAAGSSTGNLLEKRPPLEFAPTTIIIVTPGGPPSRIPTLASSLLQLLASHISVVISSLTPPTVATPLLAVPYSASTSSLVPASAQAHPDDGPLE